MALAQQDIIIFLGPPGAGKGSLSRLCIEHLGWQQISTGNLLRHHIAQGTELGQAVQRVIAAGQLVSDELVTQLVEDWLRRPVQEQSAVQPVILDGFPRTVSQARLLHNFLAREQGRFTVTVVHLAISSEILLERLSNRIVCSEKNCQTVYSLRADTRLTPRVTGICDLCNNELIRRADDELHAVRQRLDLYQQHEEELLQYFKAVGKPVVAVPVDQELTMVFNALQEQLRERVV